MSFQALQAAALEANLAVHRHGLATFTWGNASALDRARGVLAIKPSGVPYDQLRAEQMVLVDLVTGTPLDDGGLRPSSDTPTHVELYRAFAGAGGIVHTHSPQATAWAQAGRDLPCFGTTHADYFFGPVPCTPPLGEAEIHGPAGYEAATGAAIVQEFLRRGLDPAEVSAALVHGHAPFVWGAGAAEAVHHAVVLEQVAGMALQTLASNPSAAPISAALLEKHFRRKHGPGAYYGQGRTPAGRRA